MSLQRTLKKVTHPELEGKWVTLKYSPSPYSYREALILCRQDEGRWVGWIPDFGEIILIDGQFYPD